MLKQILTASNLKIIDDFDYNRALELFTNTGVKFADCLIACLKFFEKGGTIVSYDKDFDRLGVERVEPASQSEMKKGAEVLSISINQGESLFRA